ncbi:MAG: 30S ribosomal protein S15 [Candidatus Omnitrophica bacterium]|nr:30S ribosomal protein S15 [Candidatus Omnitrophota bacterium]
MGLTKEKKTSVISEFKIHDKDTGSASVQVALLTERINNLTEHFKSHKKDHSSRSGLLKLVGHRRHLLDYIKRHNLKKYQELLDRLNLRK